MESEYNRSGHQSRKGRENILIAGTNRIRGERIYPYPAPIAEGESEYTRSGHQSRNGRENIPVAGTDRRRGERLVSRSIFTRRGVELTFVPELCGRNAAVAGGRAVSQPRQAHHSEGAYAPLPSGRPS
eukprot:3800346-Pyramimonas_sp.AAC.1